MQDAGEQEGRGHPAGTQTLVRGLDLLERVVRRPLRVMELADEAGLSRSTTTRLVNGLVDRGFITVASRGELRAGPKLIQLGFAAEGRNDLLATATPHLAQLSNDTGLCSFLGRRDGDFSVHLFRNPGRQRVIVATPVGTRRWLAETSLGKALLLDDDMKNWKRLFDAADPASRRVDWLAEMRGHADAGAVTHFGPPPDSIRAVAAPVRDAGRRIVGAISVATVAQYVDALDMPRIAEQVRACAARIGAELGGG